jgi:hypothetical protein
LSSSSPSILNLVGVERGEYGASSSGRIHRGSLGIGVANIDRTGCGGAVSVPKGHSKAGARGARELTNDDASTPAYAWGERSCDRANDDHGIARDDRLGPAGEGRPERAERAALDTDATDIPFTALGVDHSEVLAVDALLIDHATDQRHDAIETDDRTSHGAAEPEAIRHRRPHADERARSATHADADEVLGSDARVSQHLVDRGREGLGVSSGLVEQHTGEHRIVAYGAFVA